MGVIGAVIGAMLSGVTTGTFTMRLTRENLRATQIMLAKLETIRLYNWNQINGSNGFVIPKFFTNAYYPPGLTTNGGCGHCFSRRDRAVAGCQHAKNPLIARRTT